MDKVEYKNKVDTLYRLSGGSHRLLSGFQRQLVKLWIPDYWAEKLINELKAFETSDSPQTTIIDTHNPVKHAVYAIVDTDPEEIKRLKSEAQRLHKLESNTHAQLCRSRSEKVRYDLAYKLCVTIGPELDDIYKKIKEYNATGKVPVQIQAVDKIEDVTALFNRLNSLRSRESRLKKLINNPDPGKANKYLKELKDKQKEIDEIKLKING